MNQSKNSLAEPGQTILHYKVLEKLGEGGMGVVYKAEDTKLDRIVALKFLPPHLADSEQDKARFIQEAKAASAINHPNICTIYSIDEHDGQMFIVMEFVDGQTLRVKEASLSFKQAVEIGVQVADGLAAAHEKGIVHRDIKPENIMIRKDGIAQIMDFGLAKLRASGSKITRLTKQGSTVGTAGYMSPEQVTGQDTDHRSDIFSLGVVLYELFSGHLPFKGVHETALMYEIVNVPAPPMATVKPEIDAELDRTVLACLEKDPNERTQSAKQVAVELKRTGRTSSHSTVVSRIGAVPLPGTRSALGGKSGRRFVTAVLVVFGLVLGYVLGRLTGSNGAAADTTAVKMTIVLPHSLTVNTDPTQMSISPDGKEVVFVASDSTSPPHLWIRPMESDELRPLSGTENAILPFWSPDSKSIGFFTPGKLKKVSVERNEVELICDAPDGRGGTWGTDGTIVFAPSSSGALYKVQQSGGEPVQVTTLDTLHAESAHRFPRFLADEEHFLYVTLPTKDGKYDVRVGSLDGGIGTVITSTTTGAVYAHPGYLIYSHEESIVAQPIDEQEFVLTGEPRKISTFTERPYYSGGSQVAVSANGILVSEHSYGRQNHIVKYDREGRAVAVLPFPPQPFGAIHISPDGTSAAVELVSPGSVSNNIWTLDLARGTSTRQTYSTGGDNFPVWSPDGRAIVYAADQANTREFLKKSVENAAPPEMLLQPGKVFTEPTDWSSDGSYLVYSKQDPKTNRDLWILPMRGNKPPYPFVQTQALEAAGKFSPDVRWMLYISDESGRFELYVQSFPYGGTRKQISTKGIGSFWGPIGTLDSWRRDGKEIYFLDADNLTVMAADFTPGEIPNVGTPHPLFKLPQGSYSADATPDGKFFYANVPADERTVRGFDVVLNWPALVREK